MSLDIAMNPVLQRLRGWTTNQSCRDCVTDRDEPQYNISVSVKSKSFRNWRSVWRQHISSQQPKKKKSDTEAVNEFTYLRPN